MRQGEFAGTGFIYAAVSSAGLVKLGASTDPYARIDRLGSFKHPVRLLAVSKVESMQADERLLHWLFSDQARHGFLTGEWFFADPIVVTRVLQDWELYRQRAVETMPADFTYRKLVGQRRHQGRRG